MTRAERQALAAGNRAESAEAQAEEATSALKK